MLVHRLSPYSIRVRRKYHEAPLPLASFSPGADMLQEFAGFLTNLSRDMSVDAASHRVMRVTRLQEDTEHRRISGLISAGEYGYSSELRSVSSKKLTHNRRITEAEVFPFYFLAHIPRVKTVGILLLQRFGQNGIRTTLTSEFHKCFQRRHSDFVVEIKPLVLSAVIEKSMNQGDIRRLRFVSYSFPGDIADAFGGKQSAEDWGYIELQVVAKRDRKIPLLGSISAYLSGRGQLNSILELKDTGLQYDAVKVELAVGNTTRTVDLTHPDRLRTNFDVTGDIEPGKGGHPTFESVEAAAIGILKDLETELRRNRYEQG